MRAPINVNRSTTPVVKRQSRFGLTCYRHGRRPPGPSRPACRGITYILNTVFGWDPRKAEANAAKHGVSFDDAVTVFLDANGLDGPDLQHSSAENAISAPRSIRGRAH